MKTLLNKSTDNLYSALLACRATPLENGYSPAELLMGRKLRTIIPTFYKQFLPCLPDKSAVKVKEEKIRKRQVAYRATPLENGYSPAELFMGRKLRTTIPTFHKQLLPYLPDKSAVKVKEEKIRKRQEDNFNNHHNARQLRPLQTCEHVYIPDNSSNGTMIDEPSPRSYNVKNSWQDL